MSLDLDVRAEVRRGGFALRAEFCVPPGLTVLLGPSGAGKSVTLQAIAGLAALAAGHITLGKRTLADATTGCALPPGARRIGYVPQASALFPHLSVAENVAYALPRPGIAWPWSKDDWRAAHAARVAELLALVRLPGFADRSPRNLSGGEAQRVALARAWAADPEALLLDEPLSALDAPTRAALQEDLRVVVLASGVPALVVTHDLAEARALADRLVVLIGGQVVAQGPLAEVLAAPPTAESARLLGWRNLLSAAEIERNDAGAWVRLRGGQWLRLAGIYAPPAPGKERLLALRADRLALDAAGPPDGAATMPDRRPDWPDARLRGRLAAASDMGAYVSVTVALAGEPEEAPPLALSCSPREWAALGLAPGAPVIVRVPAGAARLVAVG